MNTTEVVALTVSALAGGGMAAGGLAVRKGLREAVWKGYALSISLTFAPPRPPRQPADERSKYANDVHVRLPRDPVTKQFVSVRKDEAA